MVPKQWDPEKDSPKKKVNQEPEPEIHGDIDIQEIEDLEDFKLSQELDFLKP